MVGILRSLEESGYTMKNLHPNNVFLRNDDPGDVLITDVGFADLPGIAPNLDMQAQFVAPEL